MDSNEAVYIRRILETVKKPVIVELGAYHGENVPIFNSMIRPDEDLLHIMVEPDLANIEMIKRYRGLLPNRRLIEGAIGDHPAEGREFYCSLDSRDGSTGSGSILEPTGHLKHFPTISFSERIVVRCYTLDEIFSSELLTKIDLLWVDIQGAEKQMIAGGKEALSHTHYLFIEAEEIQMYEGQALKPELITLLEGWRLVEDFGYNLLLENKAYNDEQSGGPRT